MRARHYTRKTRDRDELTYGVVQLRGRAALWAFLLTSDLVPCAGGRWRGATVTAVAATGGPPSPIASCGAAWKVRPQEGGERAAGQGPAAWKGQAAAEGPGPDELRGSAMNTSHT